MSGERALAATLPIAHRYEHDREHDWAALERFADLATRSGLTVSADDFMWMGAAEFHDGRTVHSYKHVDTRRYLHLDESGHTYQFKPRADGGHYVAHSEPRRAIDALVVEAVRINHPDHGGDIDVFTKVVKAKDVLVAAA